MPHAIVGITGHRPEKLGGYAPHPLHEAIRTALRAEIQKHQPAQLITGMALGVDQWAAAVCLELGVPFIAAVPFRGQERRWPVGAQRRYQEILARAASIVIVSPGGYTAAAMHRRNEWIVDHCTALIAVWDGSAGGTGSCVAYAKRRQRRVIRIDPHDLRA